MASAIAKPIGTSSRFAALEIDSEDDDLQNKSNSEKKSNASKNAKKKARKKKKTAADSAATNELRNLAFAKPISSKAIQNIHQQRHQIPASTIPEPIPITVHSPKPIENSEPSWEEWKNKDEDYVLDQFQKDLEVALRLSETDVKQAQRNLEANSKKRNNKKQPTMSLEQFSMLTLSNDQGPAVNKEPIRNGYCPEELDPNHYQCEAPLEESPHLLHNAASMPPSTQKKHKKKKKKKTDNTAFSDVLRELHKEELDEKQVGAISSQPSSVDAASFASWQNDLEEKDKEIHTLNETVVTLKTELSQVKKRNEQLCFILAQGEMKDKGDILLQVEEMTSVKNELSQELSEMHSALEQERSKVSKLKDELSKYQGFRTKSKSISEEK